MKIIGSRLGCDLHYRAARSAQISGVVALRDGELLHRLNGRIDDQAGSADEQIDRCSTVNQIIGIVTAPTGSGKRDACPGANLYDKSILALQLSGTAIQQRKIRNALVFDYMRDCAGFRLEQIGVGSNFNILGDRAYGQGDIDRADAARLDNDATFLLRLEAFLFNLQIIVAGQQKRKRVVALIGGNTFAYIAGFDPGQSHLGSSDLGLGWVADNA